MSKRKRERQDLGGIDDQKKHKRSKKDERSATMTKNPESLVEQQAGNRETVAVVGDERADLKPLKETDKSKRTNHMKDFDRQEAVTQNGLFTNGILPTLALAKNALAVHEEPEQRVAKMKKKRNKTKKIGEHSKDIEASSSQRKRSRQKRRTHFRSEKCLWGVSDAIGGQMLDLDPIFALNEEYLLIAYDAAINVYATSTSLLVRRLGMRKSERVTAFALCPSKTNHIFLSTNTGSIEKWDWIEGIRLEYWHISTPIYHLATTIQRSNETSNDLVYTVDRKGEGQWMLTVHRLLGGDEASKTDLGTLLKSPEALTSVKILENGGIIVLTSGSRIMIGSTDKPDLIPLKDIAYVWREVKCPEWISTVDVRIRPYDTVSKKAKGTKSGLDGALDVAVGTLRGKIIVYDDLLNSLIHQESNIKSEKKKGISSQRMHWHRSAVLALKWSKDGNYIISGGLETVLVLWQLETGKKQVLPHLSTSIESIVVSPSGSSYSVRLADNSNMILSTSELQPIFNVSGIQVPAMKKSGMSLPFIPTVDVPSQEFVPKECLRCPAVLNPVTTGRLLAAVPASTASRLKSSARNAACYLQTFDIGSAQQTSKQPLARTKATTLDMGPESNTIKEPNVLYMQISHDGQWLATVDEWLPPRRDLSLMAFDTEKEVEEQSRRRETYLKFWLWNDNAKTWELLSRIDDPHSSPSNIRYDANLVLDLGSDPSRVGFATMGNESIVKFWKPSLRRRHGKEVRDQTGRILSNWSCHCTASLTTPPLAMNAAAQQGAKLAYSRDGSVLAAGYRLSSPSVIHLIDSSSGTVRRTLTGLHKGPLLGMGIVDRYLIILSHELRVWDMVTEQHRFGFALKSCSLTIPHLAACTHLAIDSREQTFAVSLPEISQSSRSGNPKSQIIIFSPKSATPLFSTSIANSTTVLLPATGRKGYYVLDSAAEIRILAPILPVSNVSHEHPQTVQPREPEGPPKGLENIYGNGISTSIIKTDDDEEEQEQDNTSRAKHLLKKSEITVPPQPQLFTQLEKPDAVVVSQHALTELFDTGSAFTLPPITELYEQVARLCAGKK